MALVPVSDGAVVVASDQPGDIAISPIGELDVATAPTLLDAIRAAIAEAPRRIIFDLSALLFLDSSGCDALATAWREARSAGVRVALRGDMTRTVRRALALTLVLPVFEPAWPSPHG